MNDLDRIIEEALEAEDRAMFARLREQGLFGQFRSLFDGGMAWVSVASMIFGAILNVAFFYAAWQFFTVAGTNDKIMWGGAAWFFATMVAFMKVWFWMRMETNRMLREIKRVELQVARLQKR